MLDSQSRALKTRMIV